MSSPIKPSKRKNWLQAFLYLLRVGAATNKPRRGPCFAPLKHPLVPGPLPAHGGDAQGRALPAGATKAAEAGRFREGRSAGFR